MYISHLYVMLLLSNNSNCRMIMFEKYAISIYKCCRNCFICRHPRSIPKNAQKKFHLDVLFQAMSQKHTQCGCPKRTPRACPRTTFEVYPKTTSKRSPKKTRHRHRQKDVQKLSHVQKVLKIGMFGMPWDSQWMFKRSSGRPHLRLQEIFFYYYRDVLKYNNLNGAFSFLEPPKSFYLPFLW